MSKSKKILTLLCVSFLLLSVSYVSALDTQIVDDQEGMTMNIQEETYAKPLVSNEIDPSWYYNTIGSFTLFIIVAVSGVYAYKTAIKNEKVSLFGKSYKKEKKTFFENHV